MTNGPITCELNCCKEALIFKVPPAAPDLFNSPVFLGLTTYADDVRVTSITTEPDHTWSRVMANNAALDTALDEMAQNTAKQGHSVFFAGQRARQCMAALDGKGCFLARLDRWLGTLVLPSTSWAAFDLNSNDGPRRLSDPGPDSAQCGYVQASHCVFGAFFPGAGGFNSVYGSGIPSLPIPGKATNSTKLEDGTEKKAHSRQKEGVGFPWPGTICHGTSRSSPSMVPEPNEGSYGPPERLVFLLWRSFF